MRDLKTLTLTLSREAGEGTEATPLYHLSREAGEVARPRG
jgi:hypothetical protein